MDLIASSSDDLLNSHICNLQMNNGKPKSNDYVELRSRSKQLFSDGNYQNEDESGYNNWTGTNPNRIMIDHKVKDGDTLNSIAIQYSVQVADIKRVNNMLADHEIYALPNIRIPVSRLQKQILDNKNYEQQQVPPIVHLNHKNHISDDWGPKQIHTNIHQKNSKNNDRAPLLKDYDDEEFSIDDEPFKKTKEAIETILEKTDANVAAIRENMSTHSMETSGAFHFVDATTPDNTFKGIWLLIGIVVFLFVMVPLFLTLIEERNEAEELLQQKHSKIDQ